METDEGRAEQADKDHRRFAVGLSLGTVSVETASADARICSQLEAELASASTGGRSSAQVKKYDIASDKQRDRDAEGACTGA